MMSLDKRILVEKFIKVSAPIQDYCSEDCAHISITNKDKSPYCNLFKNVLYFSLRCSECVAADRYTTYLINEARRNDD